MNNKKSTDNKVIGAEDPERVYNKEKLRTRSNKPTMNENMKKLGHSFQEFANSK